MNTVPTDMQKAGKMTNLPRIDLCAISEQYTQDGDDIHPVDIPRIIRAIIIWVNINFLFVVLAVAIIVHEIIDIILMTRNVLRRPIKSRI